MRGAIGIARLAFLIAALGCSLHGRAAAQPVFQGRAQQLFSDGRDAYDAGRFEDALRLFEASYAEEANEALFFNIGLAAERLRQDDLALRAFRKYLESEDAHPEHMRRAEERVRVLEGATEEAERNAELAQVEVIDPLTLVPEEPVTPEPEPEPEPEPPSRVGPILTIAGGAAVAIAGVALVGRAVGLRNRAEDIRSSDYYPDLQADADRARTVSGAGLVVIGVGAALLAAGGIWFAVRGSSSATVGVGLGSVQLRGTF